MPEDVGIPVVDVMNLINEIRSAIDGARGTGKATGTVLVNPWHYECLLAWAVEQGLIEPGTENVQMGSLIEVVPDLSAPCGFDVPACQAFTFNLKVV